MKKDFLFYAGLMLLVSVLAYAMAVLPQRN